MQGDTPLIDAARHGRADDVTSLLADGADVNELATDGSGRTALILAITSSRPRITKAEIVTTLLAANADVNLEGAVEVLSGARRYGAPLWFACQMGFTEVVTALLAANANVNQANAHGDTPRSGAGQDPVALK